MNKFSKYSNRWVAVLLVPLMAGLSDCSPRSSSSGDLTRESRNSSPLEQECGRELLYLDTLIETKRRDRHFPAALMAEAVELRRAAGELFLKDDFELALDLIDEAISLLKGSG